MTPLVADTVAHLSQSVDSNKAESMQTALEFIIWSLFAMFVAIQAGVLIMIALARLLKAFGILGGGTQRGGFLGFLEGFS